MWENLVPYEMSNYHLDKKLFELNIPTPLEDVCIELSNEDQLKVYRYQYLSNKDDVLKCIDKQRQRLQAKESEYANRSEGYCEVLKVLYDKLYSKIDDSSLFDAPQEYWHFVITVDSSGISLKLVEELGYVNGYNLEYVVDEIGDDYTLIHIPCKLLTIEEYATLYEVKPVTVRQWIRRGKIRTAIKAGSEWRIPELTDIPNKTRGYKNATYSWDEIYEKVPEGYEFIHQYNHVEIKQMEDKVYYTLHFYYEEEKQRVKEKRIVCDVQEKEKFELFLISSSGVNHVEGGFYFERNDL